MTFHSTICAISTAAGGAIGMIRISGEDAITIVDKIFVSATGKSLSTLLSHQLTFGKIIDTTQQIVDEVLVSVFRAPHSYTGENSVEISCHGSTYILQKVLQLLIDHGAKAAQAGEFTQRSFLNGKMDLSQAEAVADLIASTTAANHRIAISQMRGDFSKALEHLREKLLHLTSLLELELDFSDHEELEFADRSQLDVIANEIELLTQRLVDSFATGNAIKNGIPVTIVGGTNSGKSTLLNALLHDERAIISDIHGTTRDVIEDTYIIGGTLFRFIDTAGLRATDDVVEKMGIERSWQKLNQAQIVLFVVDSTEAIEQLKSFGRDICRDAIKKTLVILFNKSDLCSVAPKDLLQAHLPEALSAPTLTISAKSGIGLDCLRQKLVELAQLSSESSSDSIIITNVRHYSALTAALHAIQRVREAMKTGISGELIAQDLRECLFHLAEITGGAITTDEVLGTIFKNFCIGK